MVGLDHSRIVDGEVAQRDPLVLILAQPCPVCVSQRPLAENGFQVGTSSVRLAELEDRKKEVATIDRDVGYGSFELDDQRRVVLG